MEQHKISVLRKLPCPSFRLHGPQTEIADPKTGSVAKALLKEAQQKLSGIISWCKVNTA